MLIVIICFRSNLDSLEFQVDDANFVNRSHQAVDFILGSMLVSCFD